jgi:hypothetical protein
LSSPLVILPNNIGKPVLKLLKKIGSSSRKGQFHTTYFFTRTTTLFL